VRLPSGAYFAGQVAAFANHLVRFGRHDFGAYVAIYDVANAANLLFNRHTFLGNQRRISSDTVDNAPGRRFFQLIEVCGVKKKFHVCNCPLGG